MPKTPPPADPIILAFDQTVAEFLPPGVCVIQMFEHQAQVMGEFVRHVWDRALSSGRTFRAYIVDDDMCIERHDGSVIHVNLFDRDYPEKIAQIIFGKEHT